MSVCLKAARHLLAWSERNGAGDRFDADRIGGKGVFELDSSVFADWNWKLSESHRVLEEQRSDLQQFAPNRWLSRSIWLPGEADGHSELAQSMLAVLLNAEHWGALQGKRRGHFRGEVRTGSLVSGVHRVKVGKGTDRSAQGEDWVHSGSWVPWEKLVDKEWKSEDLSVEGRGSLLQLRIDPRQKSSIHRTFNLYDEAIRLTDKQLKEEGHDIFNLVIQYIKELKILKTV